MVLQFITRKIENPYMKISIQMTFHNYINLKIRKHEIEYKN
jgi:hypothetical protein